MGKQDFSLDDYVRELLKDAADLPKEKVEALKEVLAHDKVAARVKDLHLMRSDYSRRMDEVAATERTLKDKLAESEQFYQSQILADHNNAEAFKAVKAENERLRGFVASGNGGGDLDHDQGGQDPKQWVRRDDYEKALKEQQEQALMIMGKSAFFATRHLKDFGEVLDVNELYKHAASKGLPLDVAYDSYTLGLREKRDLEKHQKELEEAREQGRQEALAKLPGGTPMVDNRNRGFHAIRDASADVPHTHSDRVRAATEAYLRGEGSSTK